MLSTLESEKHWYSLTNRNVARRHLIENAVFNCKQMINDATYVEEIVASYPEAAGFLLRHGVRCIACGEPVWGTLGALLDNEGLSVQAKDELIADLNEYLFHTTKQRNLTPQ